jgi:RNA polymerase sigma factor (sigma-70 family)
MRSSDHLLVDAALLGNRAAFDELYLRYADVIFSYALETLGERDAAVSVTQDVFNAAWSRLDAISLGTGSILPWLLEAARNFCLHAARKARRQVNTVSIAEYEGHEIDPDGLDERINAQHLLGRIEAEVARMPALDAQVYRLLIHEGRSYAEAAAAIGISTASVTKRLGRVRARLRKQFDGERL